MEVAFRVGGFRVLGRVHAAGDVGAHIGVEGQELGDIWGNPELGWNQGIGGWG